MTEQLKIYSVEFYDTQYAPEFHHVVAPTEEDAIALARVKEGGYRMNVDANELTSQFKDYDISIVKKSEVPICPVCKTNELYVDETWNATSRRDGNVMICGECAVAEALEDELL